MRNSVVFLCKYVFAHFVHVINEEVFENTDDNETRQGETLTEKQKNLKANSNLR